MYRTSMSLLLMTFVCGAGAGACSMSTADDSDVLITGPQRLPLGVKVVPRDPPRTCLDAVGPNQSFNCLMQAWINVGTVNDMRSAAETCGCIAEIVTTNVFPQACNIQRVATFCPGTPPFNAVSPIPPGDYTCTGVDEDNDGEDDIAQVNYNNEPPFIGVHIDPENSGRLCDVSLTANGGVDRPTVENCAGCHTDNEPNWYPPATTTTTTTEPIEVP